MVYNIKSKETKRTLRKLEDEKERIIITIYGLNREKIHFLSSIFTTSFIPEKVSVNGNETKIDPNNPQVEIDSKAKETIIEVVWSNKITSFYNMFDFWDCKAIGELDLSHLDTSKANTMENMFCGCSGLKSLNLSNFVYSMNNIFQNCRLLESLDLSSFNTSNVEKMNSMFNGCYGLKSLVLSSFDTRKVTDMGSMFKECSSLKSLESIINIFNTSKVTAMNSMFYGCIALISLNLSHFNTSNVKAMYSMFSGCPKLTSLDLSHFDTSKVTGMSYMFKDCSALIHQKLLK